MSLKLLGVAGAMVLAIAPLSLAAQPAHQGNHGPAQQQQGRPSANKPAPGKPMAAKPGTNQGFGNWDNRWGARPGNPPSHWTKKGDWYRHVRACQQRYRSYNSRTDMFVMRPGQSRRCTL
ncbi:BA14K-like protein [Sphingobium sp. AP50]|uniref:BA14K family protein n=1 Tax=Sphingobium sp. AP50 TaxID=1884369 RepID=UPI0008C4B33B|nr:BA14K family protein [Sphingobium sp. AP50]SEJ35492.1 BA14K-like protein [Sphingobium sp. AP50]